MPDKTKRFYITIDKHIATVIKEAGRRLTFHTEFGLLCQPDRHETLPVSLGADVNELILADR